MKPRNELRAYRVRRVERLHAVDPARAYAQISRYCGGTAPQMMNGRAATLSDAERAKSVRCWYDGDKFRAIYSKPKSKTNEKI